MTIDERREAPAPATANPPEVLSAPELAQVRELLERPAASSPGGRVRFGLDHALTRIPDRPGALPGSWDHTVQQAQLLKAKEAAAARQAEEDRRRREAEDVAARVEAERAAGWEANEPGRRVALAELARIGPEIRQREAEADRANAVVRDLYAKRSAWRDEAERFARKQ